MKYQKKAATTYDMIGNKTADTVLLKTLTMWAISYKGKNTKVSRSSPQDNSKTCTNKNDKKIPKEGYISPEEGEKVINDLTFNIILQ